MEVKFGKESEAKVRRIYKKKKVLKRRDKLHFEGKVQNEKGIWGTKGEHSLQG